MSRVLALDWDAGQVYLLTGQVVKGTARLERALSWAEDQLLTSANAELFAQRLKERLKEADLSPAPIVFLVSRDRLVAREVRFPPVPEHEEPALVRFQVTKEITESLDEVVIDYQVADPPEPTGERKARAVILRRDQLRSFQAVAKALGVKLLAVVPRVFGMVAALRRQANPAPEPGTAFAVLTVGAKGGEFVVARGEQLVFARPVSAAALASDSALLSEIKRNLAVYAGQAGPFPVRALYVAESGAGLGVSDRLRDTLAIPVFRFDPLGGLEPSFGTPAGAYAGAAGAIQLQGRGQPMPIDFAHPREPKAPRDPAKRPLIFAASLLAALALAGAVYGYSRISAKDREIAQLQSDKTELEGNLLQLDQEDRRISAVDAWLKSEVVWLDEIYDLTARFPDINRLRLTEFAGEPLSTAGKDKHVARVKLKGLATEDGRPLTTLMSELVKDGLRVEPKTVSPNTTGTSRRQYAQQWTTRYDLMHRPPEGYDRTFTATAPPRGRGRGGDRGGMGAGGGLLELLGGMR